MNHRRKVVLALGASAFKAPFTAFSQQRSKIWRIGYLGPYAGIRPSEETFRQTLRELGYIEGQNIVIEWRFTKGKADLFPQLAAELVQLKLDCIVTSGAVATLAARQATSTIPIVMNTSEIDPVRLGVAASLARPGGNVTGFISIGTELAGKRLELFKEALPGMSRMAIFWDPDSQAATGHVRATRTAARAVGIHLQSLEIWDPEDLNQAFRSANEGRTEGFFIAGGGLMNILYTSIVDFAVKRRLPVMSTDATAVGVGALMSYSSLWSAQYRGAAIYVDKILKGTKPNDLPVVQPTRFELVINLKTAKTLGITLPQSIMVRADRVIQ